MDGELEGDSLSPEASAYFESRGETITPEPQPTEPNNPAPEPAGGDEAAERQPNPGALDARGLAAVREEREEKKALKARLEEMEKTHAVLTDRWNTLLNMGQKPQEQPQAAPEIPDPDKDIFAYAKWQSEQLKALQDRLQGREQQETQAREVAEAERQVWSRWESDGRDFVQKQTDFGDAAKWLADLRDTQLSAYAAIEPTFADKGARDRQMNEELKQIIVGAARQGMSSAEAVYQIAKAYGYKGPAPKPEADPAAAIEALSKNIEAETSLSTMGGSAPSKGPKTAEEVAQMNGADFEVWLSKNGEAGFKKLMGGG